MKSALVSICLLLFVTAMLCAQSLNYSPPPQEPIVAITFFPEENDAVNQVMEIGLGEVFSQAALRNTIRNIYQLGIYSDVRVTWSRRNNGIALQINLEEIPVIEGISIRGNGPVSRGEIIRTTRLDENDRYDTNREKNIVNKLATLYRERGYYSATISVYSTINLENNNVRIELRIDPGEPTVLRKLELKGFPIYSQEEILKLLQRTRVGGIFRESVFRREIGLIDEFYTREKYLAANVYTEAIAFDARDNVIDVAMVINAGPVFVSSVNPDTSDNQLLLDFIPYDDDNIPVETILDNGKREMIRHLQDTGYVNAGVDVDWSIDDIGQLLVEVKVDRGKEYRIGTFVLSGIPQELQGQLVPRLFLSKKGWFSEPAFSPNLLEEDLRRIKTFMTEKGYEQAEVSVVDQPDTESTTSIELHIEVNPGPRNYVEKISFSGNESIDRESLISVLGIGEGDYFSREIATGLLQRLSAAYDMRGFTEADIRLRAEGDGAGLHLGFIIVEGPQAEVKKIIIAGNDITDRSAIESALTFKEGEPFSQQQIIESQSNLYQIGNFSRVMIESLNPQLAGRERRVKVQVVEQDPYAVLFGFGYDTEETIRFSFGVSNENIAGRNIRAGISTRVSSLQQRYQLSLGLPKLWTYLKESTIRLFYEEVQRDGYDARKKGLIFETSGYRWRDWQFVWRYQYRWIDLFNVEQGLEVDRFEKPVRLHSFSMIVTRDARDDPFDPSSGSLSTLIVQLAPDVPGSDTSFFSTQMQHSRYIPLTAGIVAAGNIRAGYADPLGENEIPISERFFLGGSNSVRAYQLDRVGPSYTGVDGLIYPVGGNAFFNSNLELRFPLFVEITGVAFYDNGQVFLHGSDFDLSELEHVIGAGLRLATPLGPLRVDYGNSLTTNDTQFYITFGHAF